MEWVETTGKTIEAAQEAALDQLGIDHDDAEFEVVEEPKAGLFGRLRGEARVRARVAPRTPPPKQERRNRRRPRDRDRRGHERRSSDNATRTTATKPNPGGNKSKDGAKVTDDERTPSDNGAISPEDEGRIVADFLAGLVQAYGMGASIEASTTEDNEVELQVEGKDLGILIGPRGGTLAALQELSRTVLQRRAGGAFSGRVRVDVAGYRARRRAALSDFATRVADQVRQAGEEVALEPMRAADRKVVHDTVNELEGVTTRSEGDEPRRSVVILPDR